MICQASGIDFSGPGNAHHGATHGHCLDTAWVNPLDTASVIPLHTAFMGCVAMMPHSGVMMGAIRGINDGPQKLDLFLEINRFFFFLQ